MSRFTSVSRIPCASGSMLVMAGFQLIFSKWMRVRSLSGDKSRIALRCTSKTFSVASRSMPDRDVMALFPRFRLYSSL